MAILPDNSAQLASLDQGWFYHRSGSDHGPLRREDLAETLRLIPLRDVLVWHPSLPDWIRPDDSQARALIYGPPPAPERPAGLLSLFFSFKGRLGRRRYFWSYCMAIVPYLAALFMVLRYLGIGLQSDAALEVRLLLALPFMWVGSALTAKRLHDLDLSAKHLLWVVPVTLGSAFVVKDPARIVATVASGSADLWLLFKRGTQGGNHYGSDPLLPFVMDKLTTINTFLLNAHLYSYQLHFF